MKAGLYITDDSEHDTRAQGQAEVTHVPRRMVETKWEQRIKAPMKGRKVVLQMTFWKVWNHVIAADTHTKQSRLKKKGHTFNYNHMMQN